MSNWKPLGVVIEGQPIYLDDIDLWTKKWSRFSQEQVELPHPSYSGQMHRFSVCRIESNEKELTFAVAELSPNVWGFYVPV